SLAILFVLSRKPALGTNMYKTMALVIICSLLLTLARYLYYGELFPNTYFLKMTGYPIYLRIVQGIYQFIHFAWHFGLIALAIALIPLAVIRSRTIVLIATAIGAQIAYRMYVGGDARGWGVGSSRYLSVVMQLICLFRD